jgi:hypothetical protein
LTQRLAAERASIRLTDEQAKMLFDAIAQKNPISVELQKQLETLAEQFRIQDALIKDIFVQLGKDPPTSVDELKSRLRDLVASYKEFESVATDPRPSKEVGELLANLKQLLAGNRHGPLDPKDLRTAVNALRQNRDFDEAVRLARAHLQWARGSGLPRPYVVEYTVIFADTLRSYGLLGEAERLLDEIYALVKISRAEALRPCATSINPKEFNTRGNCGSSSEMGYFLSRRQGAGEDCEVILNNH